MLQPLFQITHNPLHSLSKAATIKALLLVSLASALIGAIGKIVVHDITNYFSLDFVVGLSATVIPAAIIYYFLKRNNRDFADLGLKPGKPLWQTLLWTIGGYFTITFFLKQIIPWIIEITNTRPDISHLMGIRGSLPDFIVILLMVWLTAAFLEEVIFRGFFINAFDHLFDNNFPIVSIWISVLLNAILFGLIHFYQGPSGILITGIVGLFSGLIYVASGRNLWTVILIHGLIDTFSLYQVYSL
ncbi:MAG: CPBP family intramembrane metalloprotease [Hymenobacteraceae bacterium]|nr:CPBP family intramembrane metalloprotease [Hymenobacteraceae bacterium]MDX5396548.1 CPBP family intramembrane metalloprotease [Hymenobacteraceae bacterium]MDX5512612.1 CPBP family intramembrane metalloprotease [Hymenobacteraceae bacterium]